MLIQADELMFGHREAETLTVKDLKVCVLCTLCSRDLLCTAVQETSVLDFHVGQSLNPTPPPPSHTHNLSEAIIQINAHMRFKVILKIGKKMI